MNDFFTQNNLLTFFALTAGVVSLIELMEYLLTKNIPWLFQLLHALWKRMMYRIQGERDNGRRHLVLNFSGHPVLPEQLETIQKLMLWASSEVIDVQVGTIAEDRKFVEHIVRAIEKIDLSAEKWQTADMVAIPAGYSAIWSVILAEMHGRLGYFPDVVHLRPTPPGSADKYEVAEIMNLRDVRHASRNKR